MKKKILLVAIIAIAFMMVLSISCNAATYSFDVFKVNAPSSYTELIKEYGHIKMMSANGRNAFEIICKEDKTPGVVGNIYLQNLIQSINNIYGSDFTVTSSRLTESNGCRGCEIQYINTTSGRNVYGQLFVFKSDNYSHTVEFISFDKSYITSQEKNAIYKSFVIEDTVVSSYGIPFTDVPSQSWFFSAVKYTYERGIIKGTTDTTFNPNTKLTRGMLVTILHRMEGEPRTSADNQFSDVSKSQWYYEAVKWAASKGIVHGYDNGKFGPDNTITRQDLAVILRNYAQYKGKNVNVTSNLSKFKDGNIVSDYAKTAMMWAVGKGVITGNADSNTLTPHGTATRAEAASMMYKYCTNIK